MSEKKQRVNMDLDADLWAALAWLASKQNTSRARVIEAAAREWYVREAKAYEGAPRLETPTEQ